MQPVTPSTLETTFQKMTLNNSAITCDQDLTENRTFKKLRVSITPECNLKCLYCDSGNTLARTEAANAFHLIPIIANLHQSLGFSSVRITGGEPALQKRLPEFVGRLQELEIPEINLTTNAIFLEPMLDELKLAGLKNINISLDSLDEKVYRKITGKSGAVEVVSCIQMAIEKGFGVKINSIIMKGINENQIMPLLDFALTNNIIIRFLELMRMGVETDFHKKHFLSETEILGIIFQKYNFEEMPRKYASTSKYYKIFQQQVFGVIANHSDPFCRDCDRLRLDHLGNIYGCLSNVESINLCGKDASRYPDILAQAMSLKQKNTFTGSSLSMRQIGG